MPSDEIAMNLALSLAVLVSLFFSARQIPVQICIQASGLVASSAQVAPESELVQSLEDILVAPITEPSADMDTLSQTPESDTTSERKKYVSGMSSGLGMPGSLG